MFTHITPLPNKVSRETAVRWLHNHTEMIELNPLSLRHHRCDPAATAPEDEHECTWYEITDQVNYLPGGILSGEVTFKAAFHDLPTGLQTHVYAPAGLDLREKWTVCGNMPGEPREPPEMGVDIPRDGLYIREDVDMRCNVILTGFVKRNLTKAHKEVVDRIVQLAEADVAVEGQNQAGSRDAQSSRSGRSSVKPEAISHSKPTSNPKSLQTEADPCTCVGHHQRSCPKYVSLSSRIRQDEPSVDNEKPRPHLPSGPVPYEPFRYVKIASDGSAAQLFSGNFHPLSHYQLLFGNE